MLQGVRRVVPKGMWNINLPVLTFDHSLLLSRTIEALYLPKLADPVSSHKTAGAQDEVTSFREVKKLDVLLHLHENVSTSKVSNHSQVQGINT